MVQEARIEHEIEARLGAVRERVELAAARAGRDPAAVTLIAVTKTRDAGTVAAAALAGVRDVGENRVQEAEGKIIALAGQPHVRWHLIGHLQRNKARRAVELFDVIHSVDSLALAGTLSRHADEQRRSLQVFAQVNVSGEITKSGFEPADLLAQAPAMAVLPALHWRGLMTIGPLDADERTLRGVFGRTRTLSAELATVFDPQRWNALSMGMSDDFEWAIEEGATHLRVGRAIFGERDTATQG